MAAAGSTTVTEARPPGRSGSAPALVLSWVFPRSDQAGVELGCDGPEGLVLGRDPGVDVRLDGDGVSRRHAALELRDGEAFIADLGSRNGVSVNGRRVASARLGPGEVVRLGGWVGVVTEAPGPFGEIAPGLFGGPLLREILAPLRLAAPSDLPVVLEGETGTGKEVVARTAHEWSGRPGPLVAVNCATLPEGLAEAELFGYRRGAFTGAERASPGFFRSAEGGTLLLDEVSDLALALQAKLLRVLEEREVQPLGEARPVPIDVRVVVAGQHPLRHAVRDGRFRPDLLARLEGVTIRLPPLRKRRADIVPLFSRFLGEHDPGRAPALDADLVERLSVYDWPFNVRELVLLVRRLLVLYPGVTPLRAEHLPEHMLEATSDRTPESVALSQPAEPSPARAADGVELPALVAALRASGGNVAKASAMLGITRQRAYRLMEAGSVDLQALRKDEEERA